MALRTRPPCRCVTRGRASDRSHAAEMAGRYLALSPMTRGIGGVGGDDVGGHGVALQPALHVAAADLLGGPQPQSGAAPQLRPQLPHRRHGVQGGHGGAFVVGDAPATDAVLFHRQAEGFGGPAVSGRHHVQMAQHAEGHVPAAPFHRQHRVVPHVGGEAQLPGDGLGTTQRLTALSAVGQTVRPGPCHAGHFDEGGQIRQQFAAVMGDPLLQQRSHLAASRSSFRLRKYRQKSTLTMAKLRT